MPRIPCATYRLQLNQLFTLSQAKDILDYLRELGITDCYCSPIFTACPGSLHGYDVLDYSSVNPEIGSEKEFSEFAQKIRQLDMGLVLDIVPNHMWIGSSANLWWNDILENGPQSIYASYFDIDWNPPKQELRNKVLLPILEKQYGQVIENQEIKIIFNDEAFILRYGKRDLPLKLTSWNKILSPVYEKLKDDELKNVISAIEAGERKNIITKKLRELIQKRESLKSEIESFLLILNGNQNDPLSFSALEEILEQQAYRLSFWRVASDEINYRRFFDINDLAGVRTELKNVFATIHEMVLRFIKEGWVTGLRVDHVDGLLDPQQYLQDLQISCLRAQGHAEPDIIDKEMYVVVEKILTSDEQLRSAWLTHGTTGYDYLKFLNGVLIDSNKKSSLDEVYFKFIGDHYKFANVLYTCKKLCIEMNMVSEHRVLSRRLDGITEQHRSSKDFTREALRNALEELIACLPVYRTYIRPFHQEISEDDKSYIRSAIRFAKRKTPGLSPLLFDFIENLLLLKNPEGLSESHLITRGNFILDFQQFTSPIMAKGLEDTAFYRYYPLASLNEVGSEPNNVVTLDNFHVHNLAISHLWPHTLLATSTHDTKRGEDVRARLNVLSEIPEDWQTVLIKWNEINFPNKKVSEGIEVPDANEEYLLYQTLVGTWPFIYEKGKDFDSYVERISQYMTKAVREAKLNSSWINPNLEYEEKLKTFIFEILNLKRENNFVSSLQEFVSKIELPGIYNSLSQVLLKATSPGVPDFYQGSELWNFSLVDPDNRKPVDYNMRRDLLNQLGNGIYPSAWQKNFSSGIIKLFVTQKLLRFRREKSDLFREGVYEPIHATGEKKNNLILFQRRLKNEIAITVAGRFFYKMMPMDSTSWANTSFELENGLYKDIIMGSEITINDGQCKIDEIFKELPLALLVRV